MNNQQVIRLNNIFFEYDKHELKPESHRELYRMLRFLNENPGLKIEVSGHTDDAGEEAYNLELSRKRAVAVMRFLVLNGAPVDALSATGYGESRPLVSNETEQGRNINRRVEFQDNSIGKGKSINA